MKRSWKKLLLKLFNPLDYASRVLNNKTHLPPLDLRWDVGPLKNFESSAAEFRVYLKLFAGLNPSSRILDIGCGCGQIALELREEFSSEGRYTGCDINNSAIEWCKNNIRDNRFSFFHIDVKNGMYNPKGTESAANFRLPIKEQFDLILLKSVFTHMLTDETENYLSQLNGLLTDRGKCVATFFILNERQKELGAKNSIRFQHHDGVIAFANPEVPETIVAFKEMKLVELFRKHHLEIVSPIHYGSWTGDRSGLSHQDIVILQKYS